MNRDGFPCSRDPTVPDRSATRATELARMGRRVEERFETFAKRATIEKYFGRA